VYIFGRKTPYIISNYVDNDAIECLNHFKALYSNFIYLVVLIQGLIFHMVMRFNTHHGR